MDITRYIESLDESLTAAAALGDDETRRTAAALAAALSAGAARLAIMSALEELAVEVTEALGDRVVELRLDAGEIRVVVSSALPAEDDPADRSAGGPDLSRITLRIPGELKAQAEQAAEAQGLSLNTWFGNAVRQALRGDRGGTDHDQRVHRLRGWVQG